MRYAEIKEIVNALTALGNEKLPIAYEIAKNIRKCNKILTEVDETVKELHTKFVDKDENGEVKQYTEGDKTFSKISDPDQLKAFNEEIAKIEVDEHEITFHKILFSKIENERLAANALAALIDTVIVDAL